MTTDHGKLKRLYSQRNNLSAEIDFLRREASSNPAAKHRLREARKEYSQVTQEIATLKEAGDRVLVTEHAMLRYLERVKGIDLEVLRREILPEALETAVKQFKNGIFPLQTHKVVVKDHVVVTIYDPHEPEAGQ